MRILGRLALFIAFGSVGPALGADLHGVTGFDEYAENHPGVAQALQKHPSLATDPDYLRTHPSLATYLKTHPMARAELEGEDDSENAAATKDEEETQKHPPRPLQHHPFELEKPQAGE